ncbi:MAG: Arc family DNA-binding protein [Peptococcales bacterium]|jgi:hypothetical protein
MVRKNFPLRIDMKLYETIEAWAADEFRSVNSQIEYILREAARKSGRLKPHKNTSIENEKEN